MLFLLKTDFKKMIYYRTFWVMCCLYVVVIILAIKSSMNLALLLENGIKINNIQTDKILLHHFPNIWHNITYIGGFFKIILGVIVIINISNEFLYNTIRQNIIDGLSREQFIGTKILSNIVLSTLGAMMIFFIILFFGWTNKQNIETSNILTGSSIIFVYFLEIFTFLSFSLFLGVLIKKSGLAITLLITAPIIEFILINLSDYATHIKPYFPMNAISNLIKNPFFGNTIFKSENNLYISTIIISIAWIILFNFMGYLRIKRYDL